MAFGKKEMKIDVKHISSDILLHFYLNKFAKIWSELPQSVVTAFGISSLKNQFDSDVISKAAEKFLNYAF